MRQLEQIVGEALEQPPTERSSFLIRICKGDEALLRNAESLLIAYDEAGDFLVNPTCASIPPDGDFTGSTERLVTGESPGAIIGPYQLVQRLGEGGFGEVWLAEQREPRRQVALKIIKAGMDSKEVIARFEVERQALALMNHPNVAKVFDAGQTALHSPLGPGRPYFVMEHSPGLPITQYCDANRLRIRERLELFISICHAVQHAHSKGIIHRDLKPSNILVLRVDGKAVPKVIDFGIAKCTSTPLTDHTLHTQAGRLMGTPDYMSPEQAGTSGLDVDTRSDVYSLGVILYQLLTGVLPFDPAQLRAAGYEGIVKIIRELEPAKPSTRLAATGAAAGNSIDDAARQKIAASRDAELGVLQRQVRGELDWIVMKCLEKDRARRYETANGLAADVQRHLAGEAIVAAPPSRSYRLRKLLRRHQRAVTTLTAIMIVLLSGAGVSTYFWHRATDKAAQAEAYATLVEDILSGVNPEVAQKSDTTLLKSMLDDAARTIEGGRLRKLPETELRLRLTISNAYRSIAAHNSARDMLAPVEDMGRRLFAEDSLEWARILKCKGYQLHWSGHYSEALPYLEKAQAIQRRLAGGDDAIVADLQTVIVESYRTTGRYGDALQAASDGLEMWQRLSMSETSDAAECQMQLAFALEHTHRPADALAQFEAALTKLRRHYPNDEHPRVGWTLRDLPAGGGSVRGGSIAPA